MFLSSLFHKKGPRYLRECLPYKTELNLGISKFWFLKLYLQDLVLKISQIKSGTSRYLTLYISITMSCRLLLRRLGSLARSNKFIYVRQFLVRFGRDFVLFLLSSKQHQAWFPAFPLICSCCVQDEVRKPTQGYSCPCRGKMLSTDSSNT